MEKETRLYKLSKRGQIQEFIVMAATVEDGAVLITEKGFLDGQYQRDVEPMYPKNVGRANETTPWQQALIMFNSKVNKLKDKGYKELDVDSLSWKEFNDALIAGDGTDATGRRLPMLAQKDYDKITFPGYAQRKYDGVRSMGSKAIIRSRRGKIFDTLSHIKEDMPTLNPEWELDGELHHDSKSLQQIVSMVKRDQPANKEIKLRVYDMIIPNMPYHRRKKILESLELGPSIELVETFRVNNYQELDDLYQQFLDEGYEGLMWRDPQGLYETGKRSWGLIKVKPFFEEEFEIVGAEEATGRDRGTAVFILKTKDGIEFNCRPMGTRQVRKEYLDNIDDLIGEMATVIYQQWTDDGKPFHARVKNIRDYEIQGG